MSKYVKQLLNEDLSKTLEGVHNVVVIDIAALDGLEANSMRLGLQQKDISVRVVKNRLALRVLGDLGVGVKSDHLQGPTAIAWGSPSIVELSKEITDWAGKLKKKVVVKGGATGPEALSPEQVEALSKMPSREELLGRITGLAIAPAARVVALANAPASRIAGQLETIAKGESDGDSDDQ